MATVHFVPSVIKMADASTHTDHSSVNARLVTMAMDNIAKVGVLILNKERRFCLARIQLSSTITGLR